MTVEFPRTTYARPVREYDEEFKRHLVSEIVTEIAEASIVTDPDVRIRGAAGRRNSRSPHHLFDRNRVALAAFRGAIVSARVRRRPGQARAPRRGEGARRGRARQ